MLCQRFSSAQSKPNAESQYVASRVVGRSPPTWPQDKHLSLSEAFHFAACAKRIGRRAKEDSSRSVPGDDDESGVEMGQVLGGSASPIRHAWEMLACCDGLCGAPLGLAVKGGFDSTIAWLCCCLTYGGQVIVDNAERRLSNTQSRPNTEHAGIKVIPRDFDQRPEGYEKQETGKMVHPKPIPEVLEALKKSVANNGEAFGSGKVINFFTWLSSFGDMHAFSDLTCSSFTFICLLCRLLFLATVKHEISYVLEMLEYIITRLSSPQVVQVSLKCRRCQPEETMVGTFLNLHCGHNNPFSNSERQRLKQILQMTCASPPAHST